MNEEGVKEKKEGKKTVSTAKVGTGMFNSILIGTMIHKLVSSLTLMGVR